MNFLDYLTELHNIEVGQAIKAHETTGDSSSSVANPAVLAQINIFLDVEFREKTLTAESGIAKIRKVMHRFGFDLPALYDADPEGDEIVFDIQQFGTPTGPTPSGVEEVKSDTQLYILYYITDDGYYDFFARVTNDSGLEELMSKAVEGEDEPE